MSGWELPSMMRGIYEAWLRGIYEAWMRVNYEAWLRGNYEAWLRGIYEAWMRGNYQAWLRGNYQAWLAVMCTYGHRSYFSSTCFRGIILPLKFWISETTVSGRSGWKCKLISSRWARGMIFLVRRRSEKNISRVRDEINTFYGWCMVLFPNFYISYVNF